MVWQDWVLAGCQLAFVPAMSIVIVSSDKPPRTTSVLNTIIVAIIATCQATLGLWFAACTAILVGLTWAVLAVQKTRIDREATSAGLDAP